MAALSLKLRSGREIYIPGEEEPIQMVSIPDDGRPLEIGLAGFHFDPESRSVRSGEKIVRLTPQGSIFMTMLLENSSAVVPVAEIKNTLGLSGIAQAHTVVSRFRDAFSDMDLEPPVRTIRGKGYQYKTIT